MKVDLKNLENQSEFGVLKIDFRGRHFLFTFSGSLFLVYFLKHQKSVKIFASGGVIHNVTSKGGAAGALFHN